MRRLINGLCGSLGAMLLLACGAASAADFAVDTPQATIATLHEGLIELARRQPDAGVDERFVALDALIQATHDLPYIAQFALRRQWPSLGEADRARFTAAFERLSVMTYAARFTNVSAGTFKAAQAGAAESGRAEVVTAIARPGQPDLSLEYLLQESAGGWRIINIVADGVSDLALKRAEYQRVLAAGSIDSLIAYLEEQTARLRDP